MQTSLGRNHLSSTDSTEKDLNLLKEIQTIPYLGNLKDDQIYIEQSSVNNQNMAYIVKAKSIFDYGVCPRDDSLNSKVFQDNSLMVYPGICHIDQCPIVITDSDLSSDNYNEIIIPNSEQPKKDNVVKEKSSQAQPKQNNGKVNLPIGGPNQSTYMLLFKRIHTLELNTKREQTNILKEVSEKVDLHSKKINSVIEQLNGTVENLVRMNFKTTQILI